jgi:hypothetical protein
MVPPRKPNACGAAAQCKLDHNVKSEYALQHGEKDTRRESCHDIYMKMGRISQLWLQTKVSSFLYDRLNIQD